MSLSTLQQSRGGSPVAVTGVAHHGITVGSVDRAVEFYVGLLGLEVVFRAVVGDSYIKEVVAVAGTEAIDVAVLRVPGSATVVELLAYQGPARVPATSRACDPAVSHLAFAVADIDTAYRALQAVGVPLRSARPVAVTRGPNAGGYSFYASDPDGFVVEITQRPDVVGMDDRRPTVTTADTTARSKHTAGRAVRDVAEWKEAGNR